MTLQNAVGVPETTPLSLEQTFLSHQLVQEKFPETDIKGVSQPESQDTQSTVSNMPQFQFIVSTEKETFLQPR